MKELKKITTKLSVVSLLLLAFIQVSIAQQKHQVSGKILDITGQPLPGVNIVVKGTTNGVITDLDGNYKIEAENEVTLVFSFIGFSSQEIPVNGQSTINITLREDILQLDEVIAVGYGSMKKSDLTGSVMSVGADKFEAQPIIKMDQALQGRAAGVQVTQTSGSPGATMKIRVRGSNSISGNNNPLYIVDGMVLDDFGSININDVASMEVLKDASATAIYGSRGANGVILITTKSGEKGKSKVSFETFHSVSNIFQKLPMMEPWEFAESVNFVEEMEKFTPEEIEDLRNNGGVDWQDELFKTAYTHNYQVTFSGGNKSMDYYVSGSVYDADGTVINQNYKRYTLRTKLNASLNDRLKIGVNVAAVREESRGVRANLSDGLTYDPTTPIYDDNGNYNVLPNKSGVGNGATNPIIEPLENTKLNIENRLNTTAYADLSIIDNLVLNVSGGVNYRNEDNSVYKPMIVSGWGKGSIDIVSKLLLQNTNRLTYTLDAGRNRLQVDAIHEQQFSQYKGIETTAENFLSDGTTYKNMALGQIQMIDNGETSTSMQSFLGRANYSFAGKYLATASLRADGASKFRKDNRWAYFPSGSVAWRVSQEGFMDDIESISNLKLRASYGITGSQATNALATYGKPVISFDYYYPFTGNEYYIGVAPSKRMANPDLTWEQTEQSNIGLDLGLFNNKLSLSADLYKKTTSDLLLDVPLPEFVGPTVMTKNVGRMENKGIELVLGFVAFENKDWSVSNTITFNRNVNKVLELVNHEPIEKGDEYFKNTLPANPTRLEEGLPMGSFRGYLFEGVYTTEEAEEAAKFGRMPGDAKYADISGPDGVPDGLITSDDITTIGDGNPDFTFGINGNVSWKALSLDYLFTGSVGNDIYNFQRGRMMSLGANTYHPSHKDFLDHWTPEKQTDIPAYRDGIELLSSQFLEDGSYLTLKNVTLNYTFRNIKALKQIGLSSVKIYGSIENAFILTKYTGFDPESTATGNSDVDMGIDIDTYPLSRTYTAGVKIIF